MEFHVDNIHAPYQTKPNQTYPYQTKPNIPKSSITLLFFKLRVQHFAWNYIYTIPMHHIIQNQTKPDLTIENQTK